MSNTAVDNEDPEDAMDAGVQSLIDESDAIYQYQLYGKQIGAFWAALIWSGIDTDDAAELSAHLMDLQEGGEE